MKPYSNPSNAKRAARKHLGKTATLGVNFTIEPSGNGYRWKEIKAKPAKSRRRAALDKVAGRPVDALKAAAGGKPRKFNAAPKEPRQAKTAGPWLDQLKDMLTRPSGTTAAEVAAKFGWKEHTARARISTALRNENYQIERKRETRKGETVSVYRAVKQLVELPREALGNAYRKPEAQAA